MSQSADSSLEIYCPHCGYNLRGLDRTRCPECGEDFHPEAIAGAVIPWTHRASVGRVRAFLRTVWFVLRTPRTAAHQASFPISYRDAQLFRWLVVALAAAPLCVSLLVIRGLTGDTVLPLNATVRNSYSYSYSTGAPLSWFFDYAVSGWTGLMLWPVPSLAVLLTLAAFTGAPSYFFHPRSIAVTRQNRAIALSYYGSAPLVLMVLPCICLGVTMFMIAQGMTDRRIGFQAAALLGIVGIAGPLALVAMCWFNTLYLLSAVMQASWTRLLATGAMLLLLWIGLALLTLGLFPVLCGFYRLVFLT